MRVIQAMPTLAFGDAVGNTALALADMIRAMGFETCIYAKNISSRIPAEHCDSIEHIPKLCEKDVLIYHLSIGDELNYRIASFPCKKIIIYHNVTPPDFFAGINPEAERLCIEGREGVKFLGRHADYCVAVSNFNKDDLLRSGYKCPIDVIPILIPFSDYDTAPNPTTMVRYCGDDYTNILFTGRIAPNKKQEDIIAAFYYYKKIFNKKARLFLVGSYDGNESYYARLGAFVHELVLSDVVFTGHVTFQEIIAYYQLADVFLCMSEHEGFCVPLVEAMKFGIPIVACDRCAIGETLGKAGILLQEKNPLETAAVINHVMTNEVLKSHMIENGKKRLQDFSYESVQAKWVSFLSEVIHEQQG